MQSAYLVLPVLFFVTASCAGPTTQSASTQPTASHDSLSFSPRPDAQQQLERLIPMRSAGDRRRATLDMINACNLAPRGNADPHALSPESNRFVLEQWICWIDQFNRKASSREERGWAGVVSYRVPKEDFGIPIDQQLSVLGVAYQSEQLVPETRTALGEVIGSIFYKMEDENVRQAVVNYFVRTPERDVPEQLWQSFFNFDAGTAFAAANASPSRSPRDEADRLAACVQRIERIRLQGLQGTENHQGSHPTDDLLQAADALRQSDMWYARRYTVALFKKPKLGESVLTWDHVWLEKLAADPDERVSRAAKEILATSVP